MRAGIGLRLAHHIHDPSSEPEAKTDDQPPRFGVEKMISPKPEQRPNQYSRTEFPPEPKRQ